MRRLWCGVLLFAVLAGAAGAGARIRAADAGAMTLSPNPVDPGAVLQASGSAPVESCPPASLLSVVVFSGPDHVSGASTTATVRPDGTWATSGWRIPPEIAPGGYTVRARCEDVPGTPWEQTANLSVRLQEHGPPDVHPGSAPPGAVVQVGSGGGLCTPPTGSKPVARVRFFDSGGAQRAAAESFVFPDGRWIAELRLPDIAPQEGAVTASCHAFSSTFAAYAVYGRTRVVVQATSVPTTTPTPTEPPTVPGSDGPATSSNPPPVVTPPVVPVPGVDVQSLPPTPLAAQIVAEPTYTG